MKISHAALNRNDLAIADTIRQRPGRRASIIGADASGVVDAVGEGVDQTLLGTPVVVLPSLNWGPRQDVPGETFELLGHPTQGTHAGWVVVPEENAIPAPTGWSDAELAALPLAGLTAWRALRHVGDVQPGEFLLVTGATGGVATMLVLLGQDLGARVVVSSSTDDGVRGALELGAETGVLRTDPRWPERVLELTGGGADLAVDSGGELAPLLAALRVGGRAVSLGRTGTAACRVDVEPIFVRHLTLRGSTMGSPSDFRELIEHVASVGWRPVIDSVWNLEDYRRAIDRLRGRHRGKVVLRVEHGEQD